MVLLPLAILLACSAPDTYPITGRVVEVQGGGVLLLEHDRIDGFMEAMTMPLPAEAPAAGELTPGAVIRGTLEVSRRLVEQGHQSLVISAGGRMVQQLQDEGGEHHSWPIGRKSLTTLGLIPRLRAFLRQQRVDILHARSRLPAWISYLAWRGMPQGQRPRFVTTVHGYNSPGRYSSIMLRGEQVIAVSFAIRDFVLHHYPWLDPKRVVVIPRGVDPDVYPPGFQPDPSWLQQWQTEYPELTGKRLVTLPGRLTRLKGHADFLHLLARLKAQGSEVQGLVVGGAHPKHLAYVEEIKGMANRLGVHVTFTGHRNDLREIFSLSSVVLSLSTKPESFGRTALEALSLGVPVIGYDQGGVGEILARCYPQGRIAQGDIQGLADRLGQLLQQPGTIEDTTHYSLERMLDATLQLYASLLKPSGSAA